ncbi:hypothetical protein BDW42DRAFT_37985 [Aspergillus taichungensis]|uniref:Uncharacterized protein n=1 Tax=Aspergillus taichungensis TaxID=482145 RepID=A0A2J5HF78_9EURO|nr:hypothetical protein BDW42DRAFT_37985 [Aspergillus taichungensis]
MGPQAALTASIHPPFLPSFFFFLSPHLISSSSSPLFSLLSLSLLASSLFVSRFLSSTNSFIFIRSFPPYSPSPSLRPSLVIPFPPSFRLLRPSAPLPILAPPPIRIESFVGPDLFSLGLER